MFEKRDNDKIITLKTIYMVYLAFAFWYTFENVIVYDQRFGIIYSLAIVFCLPFFVLDYVLTLTNAKKSYVNAMILDIIDNVPRFPDKKLNFKPSYKGFILAIVIGLVLFGYFWSQTQATGAQFSGVPSLTNVPNAISLTDKGIRSGSVAPMEDSLSLVWTSIIFLLLMFGFKKLKLKGTAIMLICLLIASYLSSFYFIVPLHEQVYGLNQPAKESVGKFFFVGNTISMVTGSQYAFDVFHFLWNRQIALSGTCIGSGCDGGGG